MIDSYRFGKVVVDNRPYTSDVLIFPDRVDAGWWRLEGHKLQLADIESVLQERPNVLVVGTGAFGMMKVMPEVRQAAESAGVRLVVERTGKACEVYNQLLRDGEQSVVAALHLTC